jgi:hypothetical protein
MHGHVNVELLTTLNILSSKLKAMKYLKPADKETTQRWFREDNGSCKQVGVRFLSVKSVAGPNRPSGRQHQTGLLTLTLVEPNTDKGPWERSLPQFIMPCWHYCYFSRSLFVLLQLVS